MSQLLLHHGLITPEQLEQATQLGLAGKSLARHALQQGWCEDAVLGRVLAEAYGVPYVDLATCDIADDLFKLLPLEVLVKHQMVPLHVREGTLMLAMADPTNIWAQDDARFLTGYTLDVRTASPLAVHELLQDFEQGRAWRADARRFHFERRASSGLEEWWVGQSFAFHPRSAGIEFLRDGRTHVLGQGSVTSTWNPLAVHAALFTDRAVYGPRERVHLGLLDSSRAGQRVPVELRSGDTVLPVLSVEVDGH
jgi:hypothetical protein